MVTSSGRIFHAGSDSEAASSGSEPVAQAEYRGHPVSVHGSDEPDHAPTVGISDPQTDHNRQLTQRKSEGGRESLGYILDSLDHGIQILRAVPQNVPD